MYLRLSDGTPVRQATKADSEGFPYIYIPQTRTYIREDKLDFLEPAEWRVLMAQLAAYQPEVQNGAMSEGQFLASKATRKKKREERQEKKETKAQDKHNKKDAKTEIKKAKAENKRSGKGSDILGSVVDGVKSFMGVGGAAGAGAGAAGAGGGGDDEDDDTKKKPDPDETPWYMTPGGIIGIALGSTALIGGGVYLATRNKS